MSIVSDLLSAFLGYDSAGKNDKVSAKNYELALLDYNTRLDRQKQLDFESAPFKKLERFRAGAPLPEEREEYAEYLRKGMFNPAMVAGILAALAETGFMSEEEDSSPMHIRGYRPRNSVSSLASLVANQLPLALGGTQYNPQGALGFMQNSLYNQAGSRPYYPYSQQSAVAPSSLYMAMNGLGGQGGW